MQNRQDNKEVKITLVSAVAAIVASMIGLGQPIVEKWADLKFFGSESKTDTISTTNIEEPSNISSKSISLDQDKTKAQIKESTPKITANKFRDTTWKTECANCSSNLQENYIRLKGDGTSGYNNNKPESFTFDGTDFWKVENNTLILSNSNGYSTEKFTFANPNDIKASGTISNVSGTVYIQRIE